MRGIRAAVTGGLRADPWHGRPSSVAMTDSGPAAERPVWDLHVLTLALEALERDLEAAADPSEHGSSRSRSGCSAPTWTACSGRTSGRLNAVAGVRRARP